MVDRDTISAVGFLALSVFVGAQAARFPLGKLNRVGPGFFPLVLAVLLGVLSLALLSNSLRLKDKKRAETPRRPVALGLVVAAIFTYSLLLKPLGFVLSTLLFTLAVFELSDPRRWFAPILAAVLTTAGSYLLFKLWLGIPFPTGILGF